MTQKHEYYLCSSHSYSYIRMADQSKIETFEKKKSSYGDSTVFLMFCSNFDYFRYVGRPTAASPATGSKMQHLKELKQFLDEAFTV